MQVYGVRYRNPGQFFWRRLRAVGDGVEPGLFRWFLLDDERLVYVSLNAEVEFSKERKMAVAASMRRETGVQVQPL